MSPHILEFLVVGLGLLLLMVEAFLPVRDKRVLAWAGAAGLGAILLLLPGVNPASLPADWIAPHYAADPFALFFKGFALLATILVLLLSAGFTRVLSRGINGEENNQGGLAEYFCLPVFTCAGLMWMASARDLVFLFVSLELVTISFYVMVASMRRNVGSLEAGVKYLILGALSTGLLVYGLTWIFGTTGATEFDAIERAVVGGTDQQGALLFGILLVLAALGFKVGAAPFHIWIPDVYQGAPTPTTAYLSVASKAAGIAVLVRFLAPFLASPDLVLPLGVILTILAAASLLVGNLGALGQRNFKRLLAYSSIGHAGFLLIGVMAQDHAGVAIYLAAYLFMTFAAFQGLALVRQSEGGDDLRHFDGLAERSPFLAFTLLISMASLAGIPLTAGFVGKLYMFTDAVLREQWMLVAVAVAGAGAGFYYYLKVVKHMYWNAPGDSSPLHVPLVPKVVLGVLTAAVLVFGVYPRPIINLVKAPVDSTAALPPTQAPE